MNNKKLKYIPVSEEIRQRLKNEKIYRRETYDEIIIRLLNDKKEVE